MSSTRTKAMRWSAVGIGLPAAFLTGALALGAVNTASAETEVVSTTQTSSEQADTGQDGDCPAGAGESGDQGSQEAPPTE
jgi:uncharacterized membrane protein